METWARILCYDARGAPREHMVKTCAYVAARVDKKLCTLGEPTCDRIRSTLMKIHAIVSLIPRLPSPAVVERSRSNDTSLPGRVELLTFRAARDAVTRSSQAVRGRFAPIPLSRRSMIRSSRSVGDCNILAGAMSSCVT